MLPHLAAFRPNLIFLSSGFDGHAEDVLGNDGGLQLTEEDFKWFTLRVGEIADRYSEVPCILPLAIARDKLQRRGESSRCSREDTTCIARPSQWALSALLAAAPTRERREPWQPVRMAVGCCCLC
mmetsp:Transcript_35338/g.110459  ORF Transcript_35338/g.110459 Transcript_35338/m.110459 type:complete len:125 (-) Transcript_35338:2317-2691(-)